MPFFCAVRRPLAEILTRTNLLISGTQSRRLRRLTPNFRGLMAVVLMPTPPLFLDKPRKQTSWPVIGILPVISHLRIVFLAGRGSVCPSFDPFASPFLTEFARWLAPNHLGVRIMGMNALVVLGLNLVPDHPLVLFEGDGDRTDQVFDKDRVVEGTLGDELFVSALQKGIELAAGRLLHQPDQFLQPDRLAGADPDADDAALVVRAARADRFRTRPERRDRDDNAVDEIHLTAFEIGVKEAGIV